MYKIDLTKTNNDLKLLIVKMDKVYLEAKKINKIKLMKYRLCDN
jgi:hypothetical protein